MSDFLIRHAKKHVWCTPDQDWQLQLKPAKISPKNGARGAVKVIWDTIPLPTKELYYHVYQLGQLDRRRVGQDTPKGVWIPVTEHCNRNNLIVDLYCSNGIQYPKSLAFIYVNNDRNIIIALRKEYRIPVDLNTDPLYIRFYANAYFSSPRSHPELDEIVVVGRKIESNKENILLQYEYLDYVKKTGLTLAFVNGVLVDTLGPTTTVLGDIAEFVYDSTVKTVVDIPLATLDTFVSTLDGKRKYLVEFDGEHPELMEYRDDVDFWITAIDSKGRSKGVFYHKNQEDSVRMVTHRDYSLPVPYITSFIEKHDFLDDVKSIHVRIHLRHSGYQRPLIDEHNRVKELYRLSYKDRKRAFLGTDSVVPEWRADVLEHSHYNAIMRSREEDIDLVTVEKAYGYHAIGAILADTPKLVVNDKTRRYVELDVGLRRNSTHYEYDKDGLLLSVHLHVVGDRYFPRNDNCVWVESVMGKSGLKLDAVYGNDPVDLDPSKSYKLFRSKIVGGSVSDEWEDVTDTDAYTIVNGNMVVWKHDVKKWYGLVRSDVINLAYSFDLLRRDGLYRFSVISTEVRDGVDITKPLNVPVGKLDIWLNNRALIEGLDYIVHWPEVVITNKRYLVNGTQVVTVRGTGLPLPNLGRLLPKDVGFVDHGELSRNNYFDLRDDRVVRVVVGGAVYLKDAFHYGESKIPSVDNVPNGTPYAVEELFVPITSYVTGDTYTARDIAHEIDKRVSDYLSLKNPERVIDTPNFITERYEVYSPFCAKVMYDLMNDLIGMDKIRRDYSDQEVVDWLTEYEWLLKYDPTRDENRPDEAYVIIHPHNLYVETELDIYQYTFLERVIRLFLNGRVDITRFIRVGLPTS